MLDKTQASVVQSTVVNATNLVAAIASKVLGTSIPNVVHGEAVTRNSINRMVIAQMRQTFFNKQGGKNVI